ncbi:hypothetical protein JHD50_06335 [Sulfurimonas sp. MAG313]|nr:hypothetical protein [Sulfurimonas sp. MAG313]MDF1880925.1 hypothetical protein [Sulfurimonas sp. MAG313]
MQKMWLLCVILPTLLIAAYNPFFGGAEPVKNYVIKPVKKVVPKRKNIDMTYFGFVESKKGTFALVRFDEKNIIIQRNDSLYLDEQIFKVYKITSNYLYIKDRRGRIQTVYFSTKDQGNY